MLITLTECQPNRLNGGKFGIGERTRSHFLRPRNKKTHIWLGRWYSLQNPAPTGSSSHFFRHPSLARKASASLRSLIASLPLQGWVVSKTQRCQILTKGCMPHHLGVKYKAARAIAYPYLCGRALGAPEFHTKQKAPIHADA